MMADDDGKKGQKRPCIPSPPPKGPPPADLGTVIRSPLDSKNYKVIQLGNGLKALLVSTCLHEIDGGNKSNCPNRLNESVKEFNKKYLEADSEEKPRPLSKSQTDDKPAKNNNNNNNNNNNRLSNWTRKIFDIANNPFQLKVTPTDSGLLADLPEESTMLSSITPLRNTFMEVANSSLQSELREHKSNTSEMAGLLPEISGLSRTLFDLSRERLSSFWSEPKKNEREPSMTSLVAGMEKDLNKLSSTVIDWGRQSQSGPNSVPDSSPTEGHTDSGPSPKLPRLDPADLVPLTIAIAEDNCNPTSNTKDPKLIRCCYGPSAVCITVGAGSFHDPVDLPGMAHLVEHAVFLGSKAYPEPGEIFKKVHEMSLPNERGAVNATTFSEYTEYFFSCNPVLLEDCMEILIDGMANPLLKDEVIRKEIESVDSEYAMKQTHDTTRIDDFTRSRAKDNHPLQRFYWGNKKTLCKPDLLPRMRKWKEHYYRGSNMTVCIQAPYPIEMIQQMVIKHFSDIPPGLPGCPSPTQDLLKFGSPFDPEKFHKVYYVVPTGHLTCLVITWCLDSRFWKDYQTKPLIYVRKLLNSLAPGGVIQYLIKNHWITSVDDFDANCSCEDYFCRTSFGSMFTITAYLTDKGYCEREKVLEAIFSYINRLRDNTKKNGASREIYNDMKMTLANAFHFQNWDELLQSSRSATVALLEAKPKHVLTSQKLMTHFNSKIIEDCLDQLCPHSACFLFVANKKDNLEKCKQKAWPCAIKFRQVQMSDCWKDKLANIKLPGFYLPEPGTFLSRPVYIPSGPICDKLEDGVVHESDKLFISHTNNLRSPFIAEQIPSAMITVDFISPITSIKGRVTNGTIELWCKIIMDKVKTAVGHRCDDGLTQYYISTTSDGIQFAVTGPSCVLIELICIMTIEAFLPEKQLCEEFYDCMKLAMIKDIINCLHDVQELASDMTSYLLSSSYPSKFEMKDIIRGVSYDEFLRLIQTFKTRMQVNIDLQGTVCKRFIDNVVTLFDQLTYKTVSIIPAVPERSTVLPNGTSILAFQGLHPAFVTSVVINHYQFGPLSFEEMDKLETIRRYMRRRLQHQLRTKEQLSYAVLLFGGFELSSTGITIMVVTQPKKFSCAHVDARIDNFLQAFYNKWVDPKKVNPKKNLFSRELSSKNPEGDFCQLSQLYRDHLLRNGAAYRKLSVHVTGFLENITVSSKKKEELSSVEDDDPSSDQSFHLEYMIPGGAEMSKCYKSRGIKFIEDVFEFKKTLGLYPAGD